MRFLTRLGNLRMANLSLRWTVVLAGLAGLVSFVLSEHLGPGVSRAQTTVEPFTLRTELFNYAENAQGDSRGIRIEARRSDGAKVSIEPIFGLPGLRAGETAREITFPDMRKVTLFDSIKMKATWRRLPPQREAQARSVTFNAPADCVFPGESLLGYQTLLSERAVLVRTHLSRPATVWRAPALGCVQLSYRISEEQPDGSLTLLAESRPIELALGEPDRRLFDEGADYAEAKPSEAMKQIAKKLGIPWDGEMQQDGRRADDNYAGILRPAQPKP